MSKLTVPPKLTHSTIFRVWLEEINGIIDEELEIYDILENKAPRYHATQMTTYGLGNPEFYGHLKLTDEVDETIDSSSGTAATPKAIHDAVAVFEARLDAMEEAFYAALQELRTDLQEQIDELSEALDGKAPIYHASTEETYGKGNAVLFGHLKLSGERSPLFGVDDGVAATPSAVQTAYDDAIAYVDAFDIDSRFTAVNRRIDNAEAEISALDERLTTAEEDIVDIKDQLYGLQTYVFSDNLAVDSTKIQYGTYVFRNADNDSILYLNNCRVDIRIFVANEDDHLLKIVPSEGFTIDGGDHPIVLGKGDSASFAQNPISNTGVVNWSLIGKHSALESTAERAVRSICQVNMASEKAETVEVLGPTSIEFILGDASSGNRSEYAEKNLLFIARATNANLTWPDNAVWMNALEPPVWGYEDGETLVIKAYQFGNRMLLEQKHNSHIVPGLDREVVRELLP